MANHILIRIEELFTKGLQEKTGWGKNDVLSLYQNCVKNALIEEMSKEVITDKDLLIKSIVNLQHDLQAGDMSSLDESLQMFLNLLK